MITVTHWPQDWGTLPDVSWGVKDAAIDELPDYLAPYHAGVYQPHYPMPAIRECPWCQSKHIGHYHFVYDGLIVPTETIT